VQISAQVANNSIVDLLVWLAPVHSTTRVIEGVVVTLIKGDLLRDAVLSGAAIDITCSQARR
jgi:hypothetical protein